MIKMTEMSDYHRENGLNLRENGLSLRENGLLRGENGLLRGENGLSLRENGLHIPRENGLHLRENGLMREDELRESSVENNLKQLRLTNGHSNYDIARITSNRHPISNGYKHEYIGSSEDVKHFETSNPPSPNLDPQNSPDSERKVNLKKFFSYLNKKILVPAGS